MSRRNLIKRHHFFFLTILVGPILGKPSDMSRLTTFPHLQIFHNGFYSRMVTVFHNNFYHRICDALFSIWVFFHEHSRFIGQQGKVEGISLTPLYHFHPPHRHLDISRAIIAESSPLHIASSRARTGNLWFPSASR